MKLNEIKTCVLNVMQVNQVYTKQELKERIGTDERRIRLAISELTNEGYIFIATSNNKGYKRIDRSVEDFEEQLKHEMAELTSRVNKLNTRITSLSKYISQ